MGKSQDMSVRAGFRASHEAADASSPKASIPDADALVQLIVDWGSAPASRFHQRYPFFTKAREQAFADYGWDETTDEGRWAATLGVFAELADEIEAKAIEARRAETGTGSVHESAVAESDLPNTTDSTPSSTGDSNAP